MWPFKKTSKCKHDWQSIQLESCSNIERDVYNAIWTLDNSVKFISFPWSNYAKSKKVCLKCGLCIDEITEYELKLYEAYNREQTRTEQAKKLWEKNMGYKGID